MSEKAAKQRHKRLLSWAINLAGIVVLALILYLGGIEAWQQIVRADWRYLLASLAVTLLWNLVAAYRWSLVAGQVSARARECPFRYIFTYHMIGMLTGQVVPITVGMLGSRPVALSLSWGISLRRSALSVFLDKLFDLLLAMLLVIPVALYLIGGIGRGMAFGLMGGLALMGAAVLCWYYERVVRLVAGTAAYLSRPLAKVPVLGQRLARRLPEQLGRISGDTLVTNRSAVLVFALTVAMYSLLSVRLFTISQALRLEIPWYLLAMGACVTQLAVVFSVTPGSLGFLEGGWWAVLSLASISQEQFAFFVIGRRAFVLAFTLVGTLLSFLWIRESPARLFRSVLGAARQPNGAPAEALSRE